MKYTFATLSASPGEGLMVQPVFIFLTANDKVIWFAYAAQKLLNANTLRC